MRTTFRFLVVMSCLAAACGGSNPGPSDSGPGVQSGPIDPALTSAAARSLSALAPTLASQSSLYGLAAQAAAAVLQSGTQATSVTTTLNLREEPGVSRAALTSSAQAVGFQVIVDNSPAAVTSFSGVLLLLPQAGDFVLAVGPEPASLIPPAVGLVVVGGSEVWVAGSGSEGAHLIAAGQPCSAPAIPGVTSCKNATFDNAKIDIPSAEPSAGGATGTKLVSVPSQSVVGVSLHVDCSGTSLCPGAVDGGNAEYFFAANDGAHGMELWRTDGTGAGTYMVMDIYPDAGSSNPNYFSQLNGITYFQANDGVHGAELWRTDGTPTGTALVADIKSGPGGSSPFELTPLGSNSLIFSADFTGRELFRLDDDGGVTLVKDIEPSGFGSTPSGFKPFNGVIYFSARTLALGRELWRTDGTGPGTFLVDDINPDAGQGLNCAGGFIEFNGALYFAADNGASGCELFRTDGTNGGATLVANIAADPGAPAAPVSSNPFNLTIANGPGGGSVLFFTANTATTGAQLYLTDGTGPGTRAVPGPDGGAFNAAELAAVGGQLFFYSAQLPGGGLWKTDGTSSGTRAVVPPPGSPTPSTVSHLFAAPGLNPPQGLVLFQAVSVPSGGGSPQGGNELWRSDGTPAGTYEVMDINPGGASSFPTGFHSAGNKVFFQATTSATGTELWVTDGNPGGTMLLKDIFPGPGDGIAPGL